MTKHTPKSAFTPADPAPAPTDGPLDFTPTPTRNLRAGWSAARQRIFINALAETGSVTDAAETAGVTARSAYRLRLRPGAEDFARAWAHAQHVAIQTLAALAFERAIHGTPRKVYRDGRLIAEVRQPSDRLLTWLLRHLDPITYGHLAGPLPFEPRDPVADARAALPDALAACADLPTPPDADAFEQFDIHY